MANKRKRSNMLRDASDTVREHAMLYRLARAGDLPIAELSRYSAVLANHRNMQESTMIEGRLDKLEEHVLKLLASDRGANVVTFKAKA